MTDETVESTEVVEPTQVQSKHPCSCIFEILWLCLKADREQRKLWLRALARLEASLRCLIAILDSGFSVHKSLTILLGNQYVF